MQAHMKKELTKFSFSFKSPVYGLYFSIWNSLSAYNFLGSLQETKTIKKMALHLPKYISKHVPEVSQTKL